MTNRQSNDRQDPSDASAAGKPPQALAAGLYLVATPIGHARDITLRALDALRDADLVACEDTRVTRNLLAIHGIERPLVTYNDHNAPDVRPRLLAALREGRSVVLVSDAGTPLVADPGYRLVREAVAQASAVTCVPGPSAALAALSLSGLPSDRFLFAGFLPPKAAERRRAIGELAAAPATLVLFESPHRVVATLGDLAAVLGPRPAALARELTKKFEEVHRGDLAEMAAHYAGAGAPRGEIVLVIAPPDPSAAPVIGPEMVDAALTTAMESAGVKDAAAEVAARFGLPRREVYARALALRRGAVP
jgi:16S rRNA (cytidine1402-2'-O)-methyltransferase